MDGVKFDALARAAGTQSRRQALQTVGGGIAAAALTGLGWRAVAGQTVGPADCTAVGHKCKSNGECCGGGRTTCKRISKDCHKKGKRQDRCCGKKKYNCANDCDCCRTFRCDLSQNRCVKSK
ncbi:MAG TPA: hypothetical protein VFQ80_09925 [Thermomicrobiales bacterium]|nr:hypothetical protein [Thermomicrobiales bacterium]